MDILIGIGLALSIVAVWFSLRERVVIDRAVAVWRGKVIHTMLRIETDGDSVLFSDDFKLHHGQEMIIIAFPVSFGKGGK